MSGISTHVLDLALGKPAYGVPVTLERLDFNAWVKIASRQTTIDGRVNELLAPDDVTPGTYRLIFNTATYCRTSLYPEVIISFTVTAESANYHLPLLLSLHGYTTYRGS